MSEINDQFAIYQGKESPEDYIWHTTIPVPNHPLGEIKISGTSPEHCMEKTRSTILNWRGYFGWDGLAKAESIAKASLRKN